LAQATVSACCRVTSVRLSACYLGRALPSARSMFPARLDFRAPKAIPALMNRRLPLRTQ